MTDFLESRNKCAVRKFKSEIEEKKEKAEMKVRHEVKSGEACRVYSFKSKLI